VFFILFFSGLQLIAFRIVGEYVYRIYEQSRGSEPFVVRQTYHQTSDNRQSPNSDELQRG